MPNFFPACLIFSLIMLFNNNFLLIYKLFKSISAVFLKCVAGVLLCAFCNKISCWQSCEGKIWTTGITKFWSFCTCSLVVWNHVLDRCPLAQFQQLLISVSFLSTLAKPNHFFFLGKVCFKKFKLTHTFFSIGNRTIELLLWGVSSRWSLSLRSGPHGYHGD